MFIKRKPGEIIFTVEKDSDGKLKKIFNAKAQEVYLDCSFKYGSETMKWYVPIENRRLGLFLAEKEDAELNEYLKEVYKKCHPKNWNEWKSEQSKFWNKKNAKVTEEIFLKLTEDFNWVDPKALQNDNYARRIQDLKECGYSIVSGQPKGVLLLPLPRGQETGYELWSSKKRDYIINLLNSIDVYEAKVRKKEMLLPDHKFPEIRWDIETRRSSDEIEMLEDDEIKRDFQLLDNARNQQKREVCRNCYKTNERGIIFGINYFYKGDEKWDEKIPKRGKEAEKGCVGCGWYDIEEWRKSLNKNL